MLGILAVVAFILAWVFHGAGFAPSPWFDSDALTILGLLFLALQLVLPVVRPLVVARRPGE